MNAKEQYYFTRSRARLLARNMAKAQALGKRAISAVTYRMQEERLRLIHLEIAAQKAA